MILSAEGSKLNMSDGFCLHVFSFQIKRKLSQSIQLLIPHRHKTCWRKHALAYKGASLFRNVCTQSSGLTCFRRIAMCDYERGPGLKQTFNNSPLDLFHLA